MPFVAIPNVVQVEIRALKALQHIENRIFIKLAAPATSSDLVTLANVVITPLVANWLPNLPQDLNITEIVLTAMDTENGIQLTAPFPAPTGGQAIGEPLPNNDTICVSLRTGFRGRNARGRLYWLGLTIEQVSTNTLDTTPSANIVAAVESLRTNITGASATWVVVSRFNNGVLRPEGPVTFPITTVLLTDNVVDSQRRRLPGRGA